MDIRITLSGGTCVIAIDGRLDTITAQELQTPLISSIRQYRKTVLDLTELEYVSSAGLRILLKAQKSAMTVNTTFIIQNVTAEICEVFDMTGFSDILTISRYSA
jgi:anti-sigma B factor antagonist